MAKIKVTQRRSVIRRPGDQKKTMVALGLKGINASVEHESTPQILGMVNKVKHLVSVEDLK
jgi:large subunit ribosomal protein L30